MLQAEKDGLNKKLEQSNKKIEFAKKEVIRLSEKLEKRGYSNSSNNSIEEQKL